MFLYTIYRQKAFFMCVLHVLRAFFTIFNKKASIAQIVCIQATVFFMSPTSVMRIGQKPLFRLNLVLC